MGEAEPSVLMLQLHSLHEGTKEKRISLCRLIVSYLQDDASDYKLGT
jgi:hypothetical protein